MASKEVRSDLYTQSSYARLIGLTRGRVSQMIKEEKLDTVTINGTVLIKLGKNGRG